MAATLATVRDQLEYRLSDATNLIFSTAVLDEAIRAALNEVSNAYGEAVTLNGLDAAAATTFDDIDLNTLIVGAMAYACRFRLIGKFEEASPVREHPDDLANWATEFMNHFLALTTQIRLRKFQEATTGPHSAWDWEEGDDFS
jgi:methyltransferase-like protein